MSKESAKEFISRLLSDEPFLRRFAAMKGGERRRQAEAEGFEFTTDELQEAKSELQATADSTARRPPDDIQPLYGVVDEIA
jgi:predicted ribosomally synthesized peptide with nif11-like leader